MTIGMNFDIIGVHTTRLFKECLPAVLLDAMLVTNIAASALPAVYQYIMIHHLSIHLELLTFGLTHASCV